jgi:hypothetical protein
LEQKKLRLNNNV